MDENTKSLIKQQAWESALCPLQFLSIYFCGILREICLLFF